MKPGRVLMAALYFAAGALHFLFTSRYMSIVPDFLPAHRALVLLSGAAEIAGGLGILAPIPLIRRSAARGLVGLLVAVMPANVSMLVRHTAFPSIPLWILWARLPAQLPLLYWAWLYTRADRGSRHTTY